jgi:hypothetical protein
VEEEKGCCVSALFLTVLNNKLRAISGKPGSKKRPFTGLHNTTKCCCEQGFVTSANMGTVSVLTALALRAEAEAKLLKGHFRDHLAAT